MESKNTPYIGGVTVSTAETRCAATGCPCPDGVITKMERRLIRALVKQYGWRTTQSGLVKPGHLGWGSL